MPFASACLFDLSSSTYLKVRAAGYRKRCERSDIKTPVSEIWKDRHLYSEYFHLVPQLRRNPARFWNYYRMSVPTFDYIHYKLAPILTRNPTTTNPISAGERLTVTIRLVLT